MAKLLKALLEYSRVANETPAGQRNTDANAAVAAALLNLETMIQDSRADIAQAPCLWCACRKSISRSSSRTSSAMRLSIAGTCILRGSPGSVSRRLARAADSGFSRSATMESVSNRNLRQIFGVFKRFTGPAVEGTGIGLALCQRIVERAGGRIWAESQPGRPDIFLYAGGGGCKRMTDGRITILLVEDNPGDVFLVRRALEKRVSASIWSWSRTARPRSASSIAPTPTKPRYAPTSPCWISICRAPPAAASCCGSVRVPLRRHSGHRGDVVRFSGRS